MTNLHFLNPKQITLKALKVLSYYNCDVYMYDNMVGVKGEVAIRVKYEIKRLRRRKNCIMVATVVAIRLRKGGQGEKGALHLLFEDENPKKQTFTLFTHNNKRTTNAKPQPQYYSKQKSTT